MTINDVFLLFLSVGGGIIILLLGIPFNYLIFWILKKCGISIKRWVKNTVSPGIPILIATIGISLSFFYVARHEYLDLEYTLDGVTIPVKVKSVYFPPESKKGDDYEVVKEFEIIDGGLTPQLVAQLDSLVLYCDTSYWSKTGTIYRYYAQPEGYEYRLVVTIDSVTSTGIYDYYKF